MFGFKRNKNNINEIFKSLRMNIEYSPKNKNLKTIAVISPGSKEGKSTICCKLGLSFSKNNKKTLIIDCNIRNPKCHEYFNIKNENGFLDIFYKEKDIDKLIYKYNSKLDILTAGKMTSSDVNVFESEKMDEFLGLLKEKYDYILFDTPEFKKYTDAQIISQKCDGSILVASIDETNIDQLIKTKKILEKVSSNILGVVLNKANRIQEYI